MSLLTATDTGSTSARGRPCYWFGSNFFAFHHAIMVAQVRSHVRLVAFDLDDTVWPMMPVIKRAVDRWFSYLVAPNTGEPLLAETFQRGESITTTFGDAFRTAHPERALFDLSEMRRFCTRQALLGLGVESARAEAVTAASFAEFCRWRNDVDSLLFDDVLPALRALNAMDTAPALGAVTNGMSDISQTNLCRFLGFSVRAEDMGTKKPDPVMYLKACELAGGIDPCDVVFVGDNPVDDVAGPKALGMRAVWLNRVPQLASGSQVTAESTSGRPATWAEVQAKIGAPLEGVVPDAVISSLEELPALVLAWNEEAARL